MHHILIHTMEQNPVVPALKDVNRLEDCLRCPCSVVFVLCGDILNIGEIIQRLHEGGKKAVIHADLVTGLAPKEIAADFLLRCGADGIISTRPSLTRRGRELGMLSVLRIFALDSKAVGKARSEVEIGAPHMVEILPGPIPRVIARLSSELCVPVIAGGLLEEKSDILAALGAGALCVSTTDSRLWDM